MKNENIAPRIIVAENAGFCFGVKRATDTLEEKIKNASPGERIYTLGHIIHNTIYNAELLKKGVRVLEDDEIEKTAHPRRDGRFSVIGLLLVFHAACQNKMIPP